MPPQPPVAIFAPDDLTRPQLVSAPMGNLARKETRPLTKKGSNQSPNSLRRQQPTQSTHNYGQSAQPEFSGYSDSKNKPQRKTSFRLTR